MGRLRKKAAGKARLLRNEAYFGYVAMTKDEAQRSIQTFYVAVMFEPCLQGSVKGAEGFPSAPGFHITG